VGLPFISAYDLWLTYEGKTTIAALYAQFLLSLNIIPGKGALAKTASQILYIDGVAGVTKQLIALGDTKGGVRAEACWILTIN